MSKITLVLILLFLSPTSAIFALDLISFGFSAYQFFSSLNKDEPPPIDTDQLLEQITERIKSANIQLLNDIRLQSKLGTLENAVKVIHSSLQDLKNVIASTSDLEGTFKTNRRKFVKNFEKNGVLVEIRWLPELLTYTIPGTSGSLLELISNYSNNCNSASTEIFESFYRELVSDGIALHFVYSALYAYPNITNIQEEEGEWNTTIKNIDETLNQWIASCKFLTLFRTDFISTNDAGDLWGRSKERFPLLWNDVMFFTEVSTHQFYFQQNEINTFFWHQANGKNKYQVFGPLAEKSHWNRAEVSSELQGLGNQFRGSITGVNDIEAAVHVGDSVMSHLSTKGYFIRNIIVFFENEDFVVDKVLLHEDSPVANFSVNNVKLRYCYSHGVSCALGRNNQTKTRIGTFRVFVYPDKPKADTGDTGRGSHLTVSIFFLITVISVYRFI